MEPLEASVSVDVPPEQAFERGPGFRINGVESAGAWPLAPARFAGAS